MFQLLTMDSLFDSRLVLAVLLHFAWQATLVGMAAAMLRVLLPAKYFQLRYGIAVVALVAILLAPVITTGHYLVNPQALDSLREADRLSAAQTAGIWAASTVESSWPESVYQEVFRWFDAHRMVWLGGWLAGLALLLVRLSIGLGYCYQLRRRQIPLPPHLIALANELKVKLQLTRAVAVAASRDITQAVATGVIRPIVLIPLSWVTSLPVSAVEAVLAHELAHIRRWDLWINLLQRFTETVFFFHPLVWWLSRWISSEREVCCDQLAIRMTGQPIRYVEALAQVANDSNLQDFSFQFGTAFSGRKKMNLLRRARMILEPTTVDSGAPIRSLTLMACVGMLITMGSYACAVSPDPAIMATQEQEQEHKLRWRDSDSGKEVQLEIIADDAQEDEIRIQLQSHLSKLGNKGDRRAMAKQLRALAAQLERDADSDSGSDQERRLVVRAAEGKSAGRALRFSTEGKSAGRVLRFGSEGKADKSSSPQKVEIILDSEHHGEVHAEHAMDRPEVLHIKGDEIQAEFNIELKADGRSLGSASDDDGPQHFEYRLERVVEDDGEAEYHVERVVRGRAEADAEREHQKRLAVGHAIKPNAIGGVAIVKDIPIVGHLFNGEHAEVGDLPREVEELELRLRNGSADADGLGAAIRELKQEIRQLRQEVNELRGNRPTGVSNVWRTERSGDVQKIKLEELEVAIRPDHQPASENVWIMEHEDHAEAGDQQPGDLKKAATFWQLKKDAVNRSVEKNVKPKSSGKEL